MRKDNIEIFEEFQELKPGCNSIVGESFFSWSSCECCGDTLGGSRYDVDCVHKGGGALRFELCPDCALALCE